MLQATYAHSYQPEKNISVGSQEVFKLLNDILLKF